MGYGTSIEAGSRTRFAYFDAAMRVCWGIGSTPEKAKADAEKWASEQGVKVSRLVLVRITHRLAEHIIEHGGHDVDAVSVANCVLDLPTVEAQPARVESPPSQLDIFSTGEAA